MGTADIFAFMVLLGMFIHGLATMPNSGPGQRVGYGFAAVEFLAMVKLLFAP